MTKETLWTNVYVVNLGFEQQDGKNFLLELCSILNKYKDSFRIKIFYIANQPFQFNVDQVYFPTGIYLVPMTEKLNLDLSKQLKVLSEYPRYKVIVVYVQDCADINHPLYLMDSLTRVAWENITTKDKWWKAFAKKFQRILEEYKKSWFEQYVCD